MGRLRGHPPDAGGNHRCPCGDRSAPLTRRSCKILLSSVSGRKRLDCVRRAGGASVQAAVGWLGISYPQLACFLLFWAMQVRVTVCCLSSPARWSPPSRSHWSASVFFVCPLSSRYRLPGRDHCARDREHPDCGEGVSACTDRPQRGRAGLGGAHGWRLGSNAVAGARSLLLHTFRMVARTRTEWQCASCEARKCRRLRSSVLECASTGSSGRRSGLQ